MISVELEASSDWPWLTAWQTIAYIATGSTDTPPYTLHGPRPWGDDFREKWGFSAPRGIGVSHAFRDLRYVLARVHWWRNRSRPWTGRPCRLKPMDSASRECVRRRIRQSGISASEFLKQLRADYDRENVARAQFDAAIDRAKSALLIAAAAGKIQGFDRQGVSWIAIDALAWTPSGPSGVEWKRVRFRRADIERLRAAAGRAPRRSTPLADKFRPRGRPAEKKCVIVQQMTRDYAGKLECLRDEKQDFLAEKYNASRSTVSAARRQVLETSSQTSAI